MLRSPRDLLRARRVALRDEHDVGETQHRLPRVVRRLVAGAQRIDQTDQEVGPQEGQVVVASVPEDDVRLGPRAPGDALEVDSREDDSTRRDVRLVLLALLDRAAPRVEVLERGESLHRLRCEIAVGHGVTNHRDAPGRARAASPPASV